MKRLVEKLAAFVGIATFSVSALAVKINAPNDINNFNIAAQAAVTGLYVPVGRQVLTSAPLLGGGDLSADRTISLGTLGTAGTYGDATHANVITTDAYGRISTITPTVITNVAGNAATATALQNSRTFSYTGDATGGPTSFDGTANVSTALTLATVNANTGACGSATQSSVVTLNAKGLATACASTAITNTTGNSATATALQTGRTISITGDLAYTSPSFTGAGNVTAAGTLAAVNSNVGACGDSTHVSVVTLNAKGLATACSATAFGAIDLSSGTAVSNILPVTHGGTGASTLTSNVVLKGNGVSAVAASIITDNGTNVGIGQSSPAAKLDVSGSIATSDGQFVYSPYNGATNTGTVRAGFQFDGANQSFNFYTANIFRGNLDSSGNWNLSTSGSRNTVKITDTGASGANLQLIGDGATTPSKTIRVTSGLLQIANSGYTAVIWQLSDVGAATFVGYIRPPIPTVSALSTYDPSPQAGDMLSVSDATTCVANSTVTGGGSTTCPLVYSGAAWKAIVTH